MNAFLLLPKVSRRFYNAVVKTLSNCIGLENKDLLSGTASFNLENGHGYGSKKYRHSRKSRSNASSVDLHLNQKGKLEHVMVDEGNHQVSIELINDIICDNILLKNQLEKVAIDTSSLKQNLEEIGSRVREINSVCDLLVAQKLDSEQNKNGTNNHSKSAKCVHKNAKLYP